MKQIISSVLILFILFSLIVVPISIDKNETKVKVNVIVLTHHKENKIWNSTATERLFFSQKRFQLYKKGELLYPEKLFVSYGKGADHNSFDIQKKNIQYLTQYKLLLNEFLNYHKELTVNQLTQKEKKLDKVKVILSSI